MKLSRQPKKTVLKCSKTMKLLFTLSTSRRPKSHAINIMLLQKDFAPKLTADANDCSIIMVQLKVLVGLMVVIRVVVVVEQIQYCADLELETFSSHGRPRLIGLLATVGLLAYITVVSSRPYLLIGRMGLSIKYVTLFLANFDPPVTLCHTSRDPQKYVTHLGPPSIFSRPSTKIPEKSPLYKFYLNCSRRFLSGWFLSVPPSVTIHLLQQKVKHHFK